MVSLENRGSFYLQRFALYSGYTIDISPRPDLKISIVIPSYDELALDLVLQSLGACTRERVGEAEVIIVLNHSEQASAAVKKLHQQQYYKWHSAELPNGLKVFCIAAFDLPPKKAGVGLARKIGMDEAVRRFVRIAYDGLIVCLDADCTVSPGYISSLLESESEKWNGLSIYYEHDLDMVEDVGHRRNIIDYEIFLRYYSLALHWSSYPYYWQTVGSSMAARVSAYCKTGGMNSRKAGEDFYFLHKLFPQGRFSSWSSCTVYPSARRSERVPFGTGKAMIKALKNEHDYSKLYHPAVFKDLKSWLSDMGAIFRNDRSLWPQAVIGFLEAEKLNAELERVRQRSTGEEQFTRNFFFWYDGFKVLKYVHYAQEHFYPDISNIEACRELLGTRAKDPEHLLAELRRREKQRQEHALNNINSKS